MSRTLLRTMVPLVAVATLLAGAGAASADETPLPAEPPTIALNDGTVLAPGETFTFTFTGEREPGTGIHPMACPEVNDPPTYTVTGTTHFIADNDKPQSTWLEPGQDVTWAVSGSHTFTWEIGGGVETEAGAIVTKAKVKIDTKLVNSWTWQSTQTVRDTNNTTKAYRAVLGQVGYKLTGVKTWIASPCTVKSKTITVITPREGDMSIGRQNS